MKPRFLVSSFAALGAVVTFGFMLYAGSPGEPGWWKDMPIFGTWCLLPYIIVLVLSWRWRANAAPQLLLAIAGGLVAVPVPFLLYDAFVVSHSSTNGLVMLFLPMYQLFVVVPLSLAAWWAARKATQS